MLTGQTSGGLKHSHHNTTKALHMSFTTKGENNHDAGQENKYILFLLTLGAYS